nr:putative reverse transcriptase domain-containing protein [Tanacetum cinerariifolium]
DEIVGVGKLNPRDVGPFKVLAKVGTIAYRLKLPQELSRVHHTFHVSNLKKCYADEPLVMPLEGIHIVDTLQIVEDPVEIMEREIKRLKRSRIPLVKVRWNSRRGPEFTWERKDSFIKKYPSLHKPGYVVHDKALSIKDKALLTGRDCNISQFQVMAIFVILISSDSSEDSMGTPAGRVILFGTNPTTILDTTPMITPPTTETPIIAPTIPPSLDYTPASPDYSPVSEAESDPSKDPSSSHIPPLPAISPFLSSDDDTTDNDTPDTPPSPTHDTPFTEITAST